jgi:hypothetical protein
LANPAWGKANQQTTPIDVTVSSEETVTIIDPRHPLSGLTFPLVEITNKPYLGLCCVIWIQERVERSVPLAATDRATQPISIPRFPLNLAAVRQLLATYEKIQVQLTGGTADEASNQTIRPSSGQGQQQPITDPTQTDLGADDADAATNRVSDSGLDLSRFAPAGHPKQSSGGAR